MYIVIKVITSAIVIGIVTEIARRFPSQGGIIAALPLVSLLSIIWLYAQGEQNAVLSKFVLGVLWGFPATVMLLFIIYISLKHSVPLFLSIGFGIAGWIIFILMQDFVIKMVKSYI